MSNVKTINKDHNFSCQIIKVAEELSSELSKRKLNCQKIIDDIALFQFICFDYLKNLINITVL